MGARPSWIVSSIEPVSLTDTTLHRYAERSRVLNVRHAFLGEETVTLGTRDKALK